MDKRAALPLFTIYLLLAVAVQPVSAHGGEGESLWSSWSLDPLVLPGILLAGLIYMRGWKVITQRGSKPGLPRWKRWSFFSGLLILLIALVSPLDALADQLFSAHMVQHTLLMMVAPPLLVLGLPLPPLLLGLPRRLQMGLGRVWKTFPGLHRFWQAASRPMIVWLAQAAVLWGWHAPVLYTASVENDTVHALQHISFLGSALLFWWVVLNTYGANLEQRGTGVLYLFITALQSGLLGALITFSRTAWYPIYSDRAEEWGLTGLADQQLAGTIMWVPAGVIFLIAALSMLKPLLDSGPSEEGMAPQKELK